MSAFHPFETLDRQDPLSTQSSHNRVVIPQPAVAFRKVGSPMACNSWTVLIDELRFALSVIQTEEQARNWEAVEELSERTYVRLTTEGETPQEYPYEEVVGYLAGFMRRRSDQAFAEQQHRWLRSYLRPHER